MGRMYRIVCSFFLVLGTTFSAVAQTGAKPEVKLEPSMFGAIQARSIGPAVMGGRIMAIDVVERDPKVIWVGTASGGVWKSTDGGVTFKPVFDRYTLSIGAIAIDQQHPDTVWVGTGEGCVRNTASVGTGIYRTTDGGDTWQQMGLEASERIARIAIHPKDPSIVYVAVLGHLWDDSEERGLYKTTDGGKTWKKILYVDEKTGCADVELDPQEPEILYAAMWQFRRKPYFFESGGPSSGLFKSTDGGKTWKKLTNGLPDGPLGRIAIAIAPSRPNRIYAVVESKKTALYRSDDAGASWERMDASFNIRARPFYFSHLEVDPKDHNRVYKPGYSLSVSEDGGKSFTSPFMEFFGGGVHPDHHALWIDPNNPQHLILGTDGGIYESYDRGRHWRFVNNLPVSQFYHVAFDMDDPYNVYGGLQDNGCWYGPSASPNGIENRDWVNIGGGDGMYVIPDPTDSDIIFYEWQVGNLIRFYRSTREAKEIRPYPEEGGPDLRFNWNTPVLISPTNPRKMYMGAQFLFVTYNKGETWRRISGDLTTNDPEKQKQHESGGLTKDDSGAENYCTIYTISESPLDSNVIWVGTDDGNLQVTRDGGKTWTNVIANVPGVPPNTWVSCVEASHHDPATAYVTFDGHRTGDMRTYVYRTRDYGQTWDSLSTAGVRGYAHVIREDIERPGLLFLGTEFGLFISFDDGQQWVQFTGNLPNVAIRDIAIHPREADLILATHGRGIYIIDDITPLRQITPEILTENVYLFTTRPYRMRIPANFQDFPGHGQFVGDNPDESAKITYYLKKRHLFGDLKIEIYDASGKLIQTLPGGRRKGINRVPWAMRMKPPRLPPAPTLAPRAMFGPMVPEGTYTVKLIKGKKTFATRIELVPDPRLPHTAEDRRLRHEAVMKLYRLQEDLAYIGDMIKNLKKKASEHIKQLGPKNRLSKQLKKFVDEMDRYYATVVATSDESWITQKKKLREELAELYGAIINYGGRPSGSQLKRLAVLEDKAKKAGQRFQKLMDRYLPQLNRKLERKKLEPLRLTPKETWRQKSR